jgi:dolichyldiphosphatase
LQFEMQVCSSCCNLAYVYKCNCNTNLWMQIIKQLVQEPRPFTCDTLEMCDSYGWPSSHSQFMVFFAVYLTLLATFKFQFSAKYVKDITIGLPWAFAPIVMLSRVYLGYHSVTQVLAGGSLGILLGSAWFWVVHHRFSPNFHKYENSKVCRFFRVKDSSHISDVIGFEYRCSRRARNRHHRAKLIKECERPKYHHHHRFCCHRCLRPSRIC